MYTRHVGGRPKFINKIIALSKWHLPPCTPDIYGFSSYIEGQAGAPPHWVHCVLLGSLLTTVAVQPGRCRRFIGTLLARIQYVPCTLRMEHEQTKKRGSCR